MIDYMKIIDTVARLFGSREPSRLDAMHKTYDVFNVTIPLADGRTINYRMLIKQFSAEIVIEKGAFNTIKMDRWLADLEYELEQSLLENVSVTVHDEHDGYRMIINI